MKVVMKLTRRNAILGGLGGLYYVASGCQQQVVVGGSLPGTPYPPVATGPRKPDPGYTPNTTTSSSQQTRGAGSGKPGDPIPREKWAAGAPLVSKINPMLPVNRITIHHEGFPKPIEFTDLPSCRDHLELVRSSHVNARGWGDIGYHYIVDRAGRVWEGRSIRYQGAHVRDNNENNVGVMLLGNFDMQQPSQAQLASLAGQIKHLRQQYRVSMNRVFTHQELNPTACPGRFLQAKVNGMRSSNAFA